MRPSAIVNFERLFLLGIAIGAVQLVVLANDGRGGAAATELILGAGVTILSIVLVLLASRRRSNIARWVLALLTGLGLAAAGYEVGRVMGADGGVGSTQILDVLAVLLQAGAIALSFTPPARSWFKGGDVAAL